MILDYIIILVSNLFLLNVTTFLIIKEELDNDRLIKESGWDLAKTSAISVIFFLLFEFKRDLMLFELLCATLVLSTLLTAGLDLEKLEKIQKVANNISDTVMLTFVQIAPIFIFCFAVIKIVLYFL